MKTGIKVTFGLYDTTARSDSSLAATSKQDWVDLQELRRDEPLCPLRYGTLEHNSWVLDGSRSILPDVPHNLDLGLWSKVQSDENCMFSAGQPQLIIDFSFSVHTSVGLTLRFYEPNNEYCSLINVAWYNATGNLIIQNNYTVDNWKFVVKEKVLDYKKIIITFKKTSLPYRYVKLTGIDYGEKIVWTGRNLTEGHMREQIDLSGGSLSINTLNLTACADDERFDIYNPQGVYEALQERQELKVQRYADGEEVDNSAFYLNSWQEANKNPAKLEAYDWIGVLDTVDYRGDLYLGRWWAREIIANIMNKAGVPYTLDDSLYNAVVGGWLQNGSCREALRDVLFSIGAVADCSRSDVVRIYPIDFDNISVGTMPMGKQSMEQSIIQNKAVTGVELTAHSFYIKSGTVVQDVYEEELPAGTTEVLFSQPTEVHRVTTGNAQIIESTANGMTLNVTTAGVVTVNGWIRQDNTEVVGYYADNLLPGQKQNIITADLDCTLINKDNAAAVAERLFKYYQYRHELKTEILQKTEGVGKYYKFENRKPRQFVGFAEELDIDLCGGFLTSGRFVGDILRGEDNNG